MAGFIYARTRRWAHTSDRVRRWREDRYQRFLELCRVSPGERILDVGAGAGAALERFNTTNEIVAVDLNPLESEWLEQSNVTVAVAAGTISRIATQSVSPVSPSKGLATNGTSGAVRSLPRVSRTLSRPPVRRLDALPMVANPSWTDGAGCRWTDGAAD